MPEFNVTWEMPINAESAEEAARLALAIHRDPESFATAFSVRDSSGVWVDVDLSDSDEDEDVIAKREREALRSRNIFAEAFCCGAVHVDDTEMPPFGSYTVKRAILAQEFLDSVNMSLSEKITKEFLGESPLVRLALSVISDSDGRASDGVERFVGLSYAEIKSAPWWTGKTNVLQYATLKPQKDTGVSAKNVTLEDLENAQPMEGASWLLPSGVTITFVAQCGFTLHSLIRKG